MDPYIGFLHDERPGRPSLALDMMEEFRPFIDRLVFTLINRKQIQVSDFLEKPGSVFFINDDSRKELIKSYQERKKKKYSILGSISNPPLENYLIYKLEFLPEPYGVI
ncbi:CRISPR-associated endonuclease Cas1-like protein [Leptospira interrogans serovar Australis str. 200703203]|uniref:CRISPR-associated endonuclease Cas1-like protein n=1 Tax=Leptospira interrogans serovar Australis str. 200703203 TaxID=1085541 RepID=N1UMS5_LEPIR|nr:CRISPR-associated endonuclease Cas1-like protein [Leptospira interrogans serovar Australis str. 200703203]